MKLEPCWPAMEIILLSISMMSLKGLYIDIVYEDDRILCLLAYPLPIRKEKKHVSGFRPSSHLSDATASCF